MPRLPPSLFWKARHVSPQGPVLLKACRDLSSVVSELRWIKEHIDKTESQIPEFWRFWKLCEKRGNGTPLQYVLGTQPFGELEIKCRPGVLIPRPETEAYTIYLATKLAKQAKRSPEPLQGLKILDVCTGTGCIALQLYTQLGRAHISAMPTVLGIDISPTAVSLARQNLAYNASLGLLPSSKLSFAASEQNVQFCQHDLFSHGLPCRLQEISHRWDVIIANPPYISSRGFALDTARAVRNFEPRIALVPDERAGAEYTAQGCKREDIFYARLLDIARVLKPRTLLFEVAGLEQAIRVVQMARQFQRGRDLSLSNPGLIEIWRDQPGPETDLLETGEVCVITRGVGHPRSVYVSMDSDTK